jgi:hypothetical protein
MKHTMVINGTVTYELEPEKENEDDRHIIEIMKTKGKVTMRQSSKGGVIFELERVVPEKVEQESPKDLSAIPAKKVEK